MEAYHGQLVPYTPDGVALMMVCRVEGENANSKLHARGTLTATNSQGQIFAILGFTLNITEE
jgi:hypothetical protein